MKIDQLNQLKDSRGTLESDRHLKAADLADEGLNHLILAHEDNFVDPLHLQQACTLLIEAVKHNYQDIRPLLALAYLFGLVEDFETATEYLSLALDIEPENPISQQFAAAMKAQNAEILASDRTALPGSGILAGELDYDALYDKLESFIIATVKTRMAEPMPSIKPESQTIEKFEKLLQEMSAIQEQIREQIEIIHQEIDVGELLQLTNPLNLIRKRFEEGARAARKLLDLKQQIQNLDIKAQGMYTALKQADSQLHSLETELEQLLDHCDQVADRLDTYENLRYPTDQLIKKYEQIVHLIEMIQEELDTVKGACQT